MRACVCASVFIFYICMYACVYMFVCVYCVCVYVCVWGVIKDILHSKWHSEVNSHMSKTEWDFPSMSWGLFLYKMEILPLVWLWGSWEVPWMPLVPTLDTEYNCSNLSEEYRKLQREGDSCICHIKLYLGEMWLWNALGRNVELILILCSHTWLRKPLSVCCLKRKWAHAFVSLIRIHNKEIIINFYLEKHSRPVFQR